MTPLAFLSLCKEEQDEDISGNVSLLKLILVRFLWYCVNDMN
jgi:hypothetical protein